MLNRVLRSFTILINLSFGINFLRSLWKWPGIAKKVNDNDNTWYTWNSMCKLLGILTIFAPAVGVVFSFVIEKRLLNQCLAN